MPVQKKLLKLIKGTLYKKQQTFKNFLCVSRTLPPPPPKFYLQLFLANTNTKLTFSNRIGKIRIIYYHHHHVALQTWISLTLSRHFKLRDWDLYHKTTIVSTAQLNFFINFGWSYDDLVDNFSPYHQTITSLLPSFSPRLVWIKIRCILCPIYQVHQMSLNIPSWKLL